MAEPNRTSHSGGRRGMGNATRKRQASGGSQKQLLEKQSAAKKKAKLLEEVRQKKIALPSLDLLELKEHELKELEDLVSIVSRATYGLSSLETTNRSKQDIRLVAGSSLV